MGCSPYNCFLDWWEQVLRWLTGLEDEIWTGRATLLSPNPSPIPLARDFIPTPPLGTLGNVSILFWVSQHGEGTRQHLKGRGQCTGQPPAIGNYLPPNIKCEPCPNQIHMLGSMAKQPRMTKAITFSESCWQLMPIQGSAIN